MTVSDLEIENMIENGGLAAKTLEKRKVVIKRFKVFLFEEHQSLESVFQDPVLLEDMIIKYFMGIRVISTANKKEERPKKAYLDAIKSHLKVEIGKLSGFDISDRVKFPKFASTYNGLSKTLKQEGRADTKHYPEIPTKTLDKTSALFAKVQKTMEARKSKNREEYRKTIETLPPAYQDCYHELVSKAAQFICIVFDIRRGREGMSDLKKDTFEKQSSDGYTYFGKVIGESSKNHQEGSENLENSGIIPFGEDEHGFNPGRLMELYLETLNYNNEHLFQRSKRKGKTFNLHDFDNQVLFEVTHLGENKIGTLMKTLCELVGEAVMTNHSIRSTCIKVLKRLGFEDRAIMKLTGHKSLSSMDNYDPNNTMDMKNSMATALLTRRHQQPAKENVPPNQDIQPRASGSGQVVQVPDAPDDSPSQVFVKNQMMIAKLPPQLQLVFRDQQLIAENQKLQAENQYLMRQALDSMENKN